MAEKETMDDADEASSPFDEETIEGMSKAVSALIPEDFESSDLEIPTDAEDGEDVVLIVTGTAKGGKVQGVHVANVGPVESEESDEPKKSGRIGKALMDGANEEE